MTRRLLAILAHPDDESFGTGGTLAKYAAEGVEVHVVIATDGAAGSVVSDYEEARDRLAEVRRRELIAAVDVLGAQLHMLGYQDSGYIGDPAGERPQAFVNADEDEVTRRIVALIREIQPQVVITHDETGGYFHPDHIKVHQVAKRAFYAAGDAEQFKDIGPAPFLPQRLYYTALPNRWIKAYSFVMRLRGHDPTRVGRNEDIDITSIGRPMDDLHARLNIFPYWETKQQASAMHQSQGGGGGFGSWLPEWLQKRVFGMEYFIQAYPPPLDGVWQRGLFPAPASDEDGIRIERHEA
jgi:LmbE family N-acetylglucosaminyl deacetylase